MTYGLPTPGELNWNTKLDASIEYVKGVAEAAETPTGAQAKADAAEADAVATAATDATSKADAAEAAAVATAATDATTKANAAETDANAYTDSELAAHVAAEHPAEDPWHYIGTAGEPAFQNSWVAGYGPGVADKDAPAFRLDSAGNLHLRGLITAGTTGTVVFTLPVGYRPPLGRVDYITTHQGTTPGFSFVRINPDGTVYLFLQSGSAPTGGYGYYIDGVCSLQGA